MTAADESIASVIADLAAGADDGAAGHFTLDREKARDKMRQFQLAEPERYVLELVQAAAAQGASRIEFHIDADDMRMSFDGARFTGEDFEQLYNSLFMRQDRIEVEALRQLSLGLNSAMALNPRFVRVVSADEDRIASLEMRPGKNDEFDETERGSDQPLGTRIHVKARFRPGLFVRFVRNLRGRIAEELILSEGCRYAEVPVILDGEQISRGLDPGGACAVVEVNPPENYNGPPFRGVAGFNFAAYKNARLHLVRRGVWITSHDLERVPAGFFAVVEADRFLKDAAQSDIVKNDLYSAVEAAVREAMLRSVEIVFVLVAEGRAIDLGVSLGAVRHALKQVARQFDSLDAFQAEGGDALALRIAELAFWPVVSAGGAAPNEPIEGLWGPSPDDLYAACWHGEIWHYSGRGWEKMESGTRTELNAIWGSGPEDIFAVGNAGMILHYDGTSWSEMPNVTGVHQDLEGVWGTGPDNVYAVGNGDTLLRYTGELWVPLKPPEGSDYFSAICGTGPDDIFVVGSDGMVTRFDGERWSSEQVADQWLYDVKAFPSGEVIAVGGKGTIVRYDGKG